MSSSLSSIMIDLTEDNENVPVTSISKGSGKGKSKRSRGIESVSPTPKKPRTNSAAKFKDPKYPSEGYCVAGIDIGLKNFGLCVMRQNSIDPQTKMPNRPTILAWGNTNLYADRIGGKIIKYEAADKLIKRLEAHLDEVGHGLDGWEKVNEVHIESQAASTNAIRRVESMVFAYFHFKHPSLQVKSISASRKLMVTGMNHEKSESATYKGRKNLAIHYGRIYMKGEPEDSPFKHILDSPPRQSRKKKGEIRLASKGNKYDDACDAILPCLYVLGVPILIISSKNEESTKSVNLQIP